MRRFFNFIKKLFRPTPKPVEVDSDFRPEWSFIIPHTKKSQGATSWDGKHTEYSYGCALADLLSVWATTRNAGGVRGACETLINVGADSSLEVHGNCFNKRAAGCEILVIKGDKLSEKYARKLIKVFKETYPDRKLRGDNGIKWVEHGDRGYENLRIARACGMKVALLTELHFIDNKRDFLPVSKQANILRKFIAETR